MAENIVIRAEGIGKKFRIGERERAYKTLRDSIMTGLGRLVGAKSGSGQRPEFWALKELDFEVRQGEVIGVIGHNGAGKSTLLKILSRITEPTEGHVDIWGRVGSLLEVGTGFHHELTGRENIYLSGAILGMTKNDIDTRFDEIVGFAGVEKFVDTPIKHYSTGMSLRLGFAVAAHLEPDILLVDEVLAVGDLAFQKKCLNKMEDVATEGRTVMFVSHNMASIKELCQTALVLRKGKMDFYGDVVQGIQHYSQNVLGIGTDGEEDHGGEGWLGISVNGDRGQTVINNNEQFRVSGDLSLVEPLKRVVIHCIMENSEGNQVVHNRYFGADNLATGTHRFNGVVPPLYLKPGVYTVFFKLIAEDMDGNPIKFVSERLVADLTDKTELYSGKVYATVLPPVEWEVETLEARAGSLTEPEVRAGIQ